MKRELSLYQRFYLAVRLGNSDKAMSLFLQAVNDDFDNLIDYFIVLWERGRNG